MAKRVRGLIHKRFETDGLGLVHVHDADHASPSSWLLLVKGTALESRRYPVPKKMGRYREEAYGSDCATPTKTQNFIRRARHRERFA